MAEAKASNPVFWLYSRAHVAQTCVVKSVTILSKMLDKALNLKDKLPDLAKSPDSNLDDWQMELDTLIKDGMEPT